ncbi:MAG: efflux RND transporter periplasmic adaptor subunit [Bacteroidales bacterium]
MKKATKITLWISIPLVLAVGFAGPRLGLFGNRKGEAAKNSAASATQGQPQGKGQEQRPGGQQAGALLPVQAIIAKPSYLTNGIRSAGTLLANEEVDIVSKVAGKVTGVFFKEGSTVKKGDLLVKIYDEDLQAQLRRSEIQEKLLAEKLERQRVLLSKDAVSRESFDQLQTDYNVILADINLLKVRIAETEVRAPFNGVIGFRYVSEGSYVQPSVKIAHLIDYSQMKLEFAIPEKYVSQSLMGRKIAFRTQGYDDEFIAYVYAIDYRVDEATRTIGLRARYDNRDKRLVPGMFADLTLITSEKNNAIQVPSESVVPEMNEKRIWLFKNGKAVLVPVVSGTRTEIDVEILSGVNAGDTVITSGLMQLRPNMPVRVNITE